MEDIKQIINRSNYLTPSRYISGRIVEYDIKSANISVLRDSNIITQEDYDRLSILPKLEREREIGIREKLDPTLYKSIQEGICEARNKLASFNELNDTSIIRIANDAVYINSNNNLKYLKFGNYIEFRPKSEYNVYCNLKGIIIFCKFEDDGNIHIDIKGLGNSISYHQNYMIYTIMSTITLLERSGVEDSIDYISDICKRYLTLELPIEYYREFNNDSIYRFKHEFALHDDGKVKTFNFGISDFSILDNSYKQCLDINYNYTILRELWSIIFEIYTIRKR
jgi:hypothetical protein